MRYAEVLSVAEGVAGVVMRLARSRHAQLVEEDPKTPATVDGTAAEVLRLVELRVSAELAGEEEA